MSGSGLHGPAGRLFECHPAGVATPSADRPVLIVNMEIGCAIPDSAHKGRHAGLSGDPYACEPVIAPAMMRQAVLGLAQ
jgi:hypothetical protein